VPPYKAIGGEMPKFTNVQALNIEYFSQALQIHMEQIEVCLDEGLGTGIGLGTEFDQDNLLRMDSVTQMDVLDKGKSIMSPNEQRKKLDLKPTPGGNVVYRQQQDFSLEALAKRDAQDNPFGTAAPAGPTPAETQAANDNATAAAAKEAMIEILKGFR
jgi:phage portal protein BeeE